MDCSAYTIAEEPIFRVSVPTKRGAPLHPKPSMRRTPTYFYISHNYHFGITRKRREDGKGFLRTVGGQPQTAGAADCVRHTERPLPFEGRDRERVHQAVLHEGVRGLLQQGGSQRHDEEDDGGSDSLTLRDYV